MADERKEEERIESAQIKDGELDTSPASENRVAAPMPLSEKDRRRDYTHTVCGTENVMSDEAAARFYTDPDTCTSLLCVGPECGCGIRIGEDGEMVWTGTKEPVVPGVAPPKRGTAGK